MLASELMIALGHNIAQSGDKEIFVEDSYDSIFGVELMEDQSAFIITEIDQQGR